MSLLEQKKTQTLDRTLYKASSWTRRVSLVVCRSFRPSSLQFSVQSKLIIHREAGTETFHAITYNQSSFSLTLASRLPSRPFLQRTTTPTSRQLLLRSTDNVLVCSPTILSVEVGTTAIQRAADLVLPRDLHPAPPRVRRLVPSCLSPLQHSLSHRGSIFHGHSSSETLLDAV